MRSSATLLEALEKIKIPDEMKEDYTLVGSRLAGLFNHFNIEGKIALVNNDSGTEDEDFAFELSRKMILAIRSKDGGYEGMNKLLIELQKSGTLKLSPSIQDADYLKTAVLPAVYLVLQFPQVDLSSFYSSSIKNALQEVMTTLNKGRSVRLSPAELFNKLFTECYSGEARDLATLKAELINKGHRAFPLNPLFEFGPKKTAAASSNGVSITRAAVTKEKEAYATALQQLFKTGAPLAGFPLAASSDLGGPKALNALIVMTDELENHFKNGYVALLKELQGHTAKYFSSALTQETIQNEIAPWIYLAFRRKYLLHSRPLFLQKRFLAWFCWLPLTGQLKQSYRR